MAWRGMNKNTGAEISETDHIRQSVRDILTTPVGTRVMRRTYGSLLFELIDQPVNRANRLRLMAATVSAITQWEPRINISRLDPYHDSAGRVIISMEAERVDTGEMITIAGIQVNE